MPDLPARFAAIIVAFAPLFRHQTWYHAEILLAGAMDLLREGYCWRMGRSVEARSAFKL